MRTGHYYHILCGACIWAPAKLIKADKSTRRFLSLSDGKFYDVLPNAIRDIPIEKVHLERLGFVENWHFDICVMPVHIIYYPDLSALEQSYFGHIAFFRDQMGLMERRLAIAQRQLYHLCEEKPGEVALHRTEIMKVLRSFSTLNTLFTRLEILGLQFDREKIVRGC